MIVYPFSLGLLLANCYFAVCGKTKEAIIIDPADEGDFLLQKIKELSIKPLFIVATHGHFDHLLAALEMKLALKISFLMNKKDLPLLARHQKTARYFLKYEVDPVSKVDKFLKEGDILRFGQEKLRVMETPGHTEGSVCFLSQSSGAAHLFTGDTIFSDGSIGRTDLEGGSKEKLRESIKKLAKLPPQTVIYPGHGETGGKIVDFWERAVI